MSTQTLSEELRNISENEASNLTFGAKLRKLVADSREEKRLRTIYAPLFEWAERGYTSFSFRKGDLPVNDLYGIIHHGDNDHWYLDWAGSKTSLAVKLREIALKKRLELVDFHINLIQTNCILRAKEEEECCIFTFDSKCDEGEVPVEVPFHPDVIKWIKQNGLYWNYGQESLSIQWH